MRVCALTGIFPVNVTGTVTRLCRTPVARALADVVDAGCAIGQPGRSIRVRSQTGNGGGSVLAR
jgi:hypothetical protein